MRSGLLKIVQIRGLNFLLVEMKFMQTVKHSNVYFGAINPLIFSVLETKDPLFVFEFETFRFEAI